MKEVLLLLSIGLAVGIPTAMALGRFVASQLYGIEARDPWMAAATVVLADGGLRRRRPDPGASRQPHRSDSRACATSNRTDHDDHRRKLQKPQNLLNKIASASSLSSAFDRRVRCVNIPPTYEEGR